MCPQILSTTMLSSSLSDYVYQNEFQTSAAEGSANLFRSGDVIKSLKHPENRGTMRPPESEVPSECHSWRLSGPVYFLCSSRDELEMTRLATNTDQSVNADTSKFVENQFFYARHVLTSGVF